MTIHLGGAEEPQDVIDWSSWAKDQCCPGVHKGLTATITSNNPSVHGDAERQWNKAGIEFTLSLPTAAPFPTVS